MNAERTAKRIENLIGRYEEVGIDNLKEGMPYAVLGVFMDEPEPRERAEIGRVESDGYKSRLQMVLGEKPCFVKENGSFLDRDGYSGSAYASKIAEKRRYN